ncbi:hypothetical protein EDD86DRAFT_80508 [Gorgonomyces haynaldii]|nr:hypothetical protein EDD86DRAFT_80508 [Gorgonomyces haynaldii]
MHPKCMLLLPLFVSAFVQNARPTNDAGVDEPPVAAPNGGVPTPIDEPRPTNDSGIDEPPVAAPNGGIPTVIGQPQETPTQEPQRPQKPNKPIEIPRFTIPIFTITVPPLPSIPPKTVRPKPTRTAKPTQMPPSMPTIVTQQLPQSRAPRETDMSSMDMYTAFPTQTTEPNVVSSDPSKFIGWAFIALLL